MKKTTAQELAELRKEVKQLTKLVKDGTKIKVNEIESCLDKKFEKGKWYKDTQHAPCIVNYQGGNSGYGVNNASNWCDNDWWSFESRPKDYKPATDKEVEEMLIKEAKKRVLLKGQAKIKTVSGSTHTWGNDCWIFTFTEGCLKSHGLPIFQNGEWAEIIKNNTLNGKEVTIEDDTISIGCVNISVSEFKDTIESLDDVNIDTIHHSELGDIKVSDLKKLV